MKNVGLISALLMLMSFSVLVGPMNEMSHYSFHKPDETVISAVNTISDADVMTETVPTIIKKWQFNALFPSTHSLHALRGTFIPFKFIHHVFSSTDSAGFITVVQHQSNYLA